MTNRELTRKALELPLTERVELAQALWQSIDDEPGSRIPAEDRQTIELARERARDLATGKVKGRTHQQVMESARRALE
jgi:putative addiction module component (TIGR02574 family)